MALEAFKHTQGKKFKQKRVTANVGNKEKEKETEVGNTAGQTVGCLRHH